MEPYVLRGMNSDPQMQRVLQDLTDRINFLSRELESVRGEIPSGMARKENPIEGILSIPPMGTGGSRRTISRNFTQVGNVTTGLDPLHIITIPKGTLSTDGDYIWVRSGGNYANTEADKQLRLRIDGNLVISFGAVIDLENGAWVVDYIFIRISPVQIAWIGIDMHVQFRMADGVVVATPSGSFLVPRTVAPVTVSNLNTTDILLEFHGEGTNTDDVIQRYTIIETIQQNPIGSGFVRINADGVIASYTNPL